MDLSFPERSCKPALSNGNVANTPSTGQTVFKKHLFTLELPKKINENPTFIPENTLRKLKTEGRFCPIITNAYLKPTSLKFNAQGLFFLS